MFGGGHLGENRGITARRKQENTLASFQANVNEATLIKNRVQWENRTKQVCENTLVRNVASTLRQNDTDKLTDRRRRLAHLLESEHNMFREELKGLQETSVQRAERLLNSAKALKDKREHQRMEFATEMYNKQWRESCDDLRTIESDHFRAYCHDAVTKQKLEKARIAEENGREESRWKDILEDTRLKQEARELNDIKTRKDMQMENRRLLLEQMDTQRRSRTEQQQAEKQARDAFQRQMERDAEELKQLEFEDFKRKRAEMRDLALYNKEAVNRRNEAEEERRAIERAWLYEDLETHEEESGAHHAKKLAAFQEMRDYRDFLRQRKEEEAAQERELDSMLQEELDRQQAKRDAEKRREDIARARLMDDVYRTRERQIAEKEEERRRHKEQIMIDRENVMAAIENEKGLQGQEDAEERRNAFMMRQDLEKQIRMKEMHKKLEQAQIQIEREYSEQAEAQYRAFLERERGKGASYRPPIRGLNTRFTQTVGHSVGRSY